MSQALLRRCSGAVLDLLLPAKCALCLMAPGPGLCAPCLAALPTLDDPCPWCAAGQGRDHCLACGHRGFPHIDSTRCALVYTGACRRLVTRAKAEARPAAVAACADLMPEPPQDLFDDAVIVPVPPSPGRRPGPHLGTRLARAVASAAHRPLRCCLATTRPAAEQHRLGLAERRDNVRDLFACRGPAPRRVILVDDLVTSGATATAAASALAAAGTEHIDLIALARTQRKS